MPTETAQRVTRADILTFEQAAARLGIGTATVRHMVKQWQTEPLVAADGLPVVGQLRPAYDDMGYHVGLLRAEVERTLRWLATEWQRNPSAATPDQMLRSLNAWRSDLRAKHAAASDPTPQVCLVPVLGTTPAPLLAAPQPPKRYSISQAAKKLGMTEHTLGQLVLLGYFDARTVDGVTMLDASLVRLYRRDM